MAGHRDRPRRRREASVSVIALSPVEQQVIRLAIAMQKDRDRASQQIMERDIAPVLAAHDCTGLKVNIVDHEGGMGLEVQP